MSKKECPCYDEKSHTHVLISFYCLCWYKTIILLETLHFKDHIVKKFRFNVTKEG